MSQALPYSQTILLDANRLSSEEYSASNLAQTNTAVFTNRVAGGLTLDIGDQVSIQSAHIAQRGAGGDVIEMKGRNLGKKTINYTNFTNGSYIGYFIKNQGGLPRYSPTGYAKVDAENIDEEVDMKDNEATIVLEFYKTANGENCMTLPRNFGNASANNASVAGYNAAGGTKFTDAASYWETKDGFPLGVNTFQYDLYRRFIFGNGLRIDDDWNNIYVLGRFDGTQESDGVKVRQDNSRFTLFKRSSMVYNGSEVTLTELADSLQPRAGVAPDPAVADYVRFRKKVKLTINEGYNTPSNIASEITDQLTEPEDSRLVIIDEGSDKTIIQESKLNVAFGAPSYSSFNSSRCKDFFNASLSNSMPVNVTSASSVQSANSVAYNNAYDYIGFKRPDFIETGRRAFPYNGVSLEVDITSAEFAVIEIDLAWNDDNLSKIADWFNSQTEYPELLDGGVDTGFPRTNYRVTFPDIADVESDFRSKARFIHMDIGYESQGAQKADIEPLGDDMYNVSYSSAGANASDRTSAPVFIYFNNNSSHLKANDGDANGYDNLAYGFALKRNNKICFTTERIGGIPQIWMAAGPTFGTILEGTKVGFDYHFSAYGNAAIALHAGYNPLQYFGHQSFLQGQYIENVYVGADNPLFTFDTVESRFEFKNLHTAEKTSNFYNAGDPQVPGDILGPPPSATAQDSVYFVNKQMRYDNWSPDMHPYPTINLSGTVTNNNVQSFINPPDRLQGGLPYDAHSGVTIVDMGITESKWEESIWGLLGFSYGQFNPDSKTVIKNTNFKFNNLPSNVSGITTNALLTSLQSQQYFQNAFSIPLIKPMVGSNVLYFNSSRSHGDPITVGNASYVVLPSISVQQESTVIKARDLPRKILRGYFLIKSDIIDQTGYYQLSNPMSVMMTVGKYNSADDFVNSDTEGTSFTVTRKKTLTDIKTQITDPEGSLAQVGDNSGVVYKIVKQINTDLKFGENLYAGMYGKPPQ